MKTRRAALIGLFFALGAALAAVTGGGQAPMWLGPVLMELGQALRNLSLSGGAGNALAWTLLIALGLLPLMGLLPLKRARAASDWLWFAAAAYAVFMLYMLVNPHMLRNIVYPDWAQPEPALLAATLLGPLAALILAALFLRLARGDAQGPLLFARLRLLLTVEQALAAFAGGWRIPALFSLAGADLAYGVVDAAGTLIELLLLILVCEAGKALLKSLGRGWLNDENAPLADRLALWAQRMLLGGIAVMLTRCFLTLALGAQLTNVNMTVNFSFGDLIIALSALLLARFVREGVRVRRENDQFI